MQKKLVSALVAELIGTFALCFVGIMSINIMKGTPGALIGIALAHGLILAVFITITGATSGGHLNPAVTVGLLAGGKIKAPEAIGYIIAQCIGGMLGGLAVYGIYGSASAVLDGTPVVGMTANAKELMNFGSAVLAEAIATFFLVSAVWGTAVDPRAPKIGGFGIGLSLTASILAIGPLTGAALNPARTFGPAVAALFCGGSYPWGQMWIYWVGPIAGGLVASIVYKAFFWPTKDAA